MPFPTTIDTPDTTMQGTTLFTGDDHALNHRTLGSSIIAIENNLGTNAGTSILKNFNAGDFGARINSGGILQQTLTGTVNLQGQATASGTMANGVYGTATYQGGTGNSMVLGTPSVDYFSARNAGTGLGFNNSIFPAEGTLTDVAGGTLTVDARTAQIYYSVMGTGAGNRTIATPTNLSPYQQLTYAFKTSGSANGTLVWGTIFRISQDYGTPTLGTGVGWNYFTWRYNSIDSKLDFQGQIKNEV